MQAPNEPGQEIDVSLMESTFRMLDFLAIEYDQLGVVREPHRQPQRLFRTQQHIS